MIPLNGLMDVQRWGASDAPQRRELAREWILPRVLARGGTLLDAEFNPSQRLRGRYASSYAELIASLDPLPGWHEQTFARGVPYVGRCFQSLLARSQDANTDEVERMRDFAPLWIVDLDDPAIPVAARESVRARAEAAASERAGWLPDNLLDLLEKNPSASKPRRMIELRNGDVRTTIRNGDLVLVHAGAMLTVGSSKETIAPEPDWSGAVRFVSLGKRARATVSCGQPPAHWFIRALAIAPATFYPLGMMGDGLSWNSILFSMLLQLLWLMLFSSLWIAKRRLRLPSFWRYWLVSIVLVSLLPAMLFGAIGAMGLVNFEQDTLGVSVIVLGACFPSARALFSLFKKPPHSLP